MKKKFSGALPFRTTLILMMLAAPCLMGAAGTMSAETQRVQQQKHTIKGVVVDEVGEPLIGATVMVKGTGDGVATNVDGEYTITTNATSPVLVVSYIGYDAQEIAVGGRQVIDVKLVPASGHNIQEVVVTAMGILRKEKSLTYATQQVKAEESRGPHEGSGRECGQLA